MGRTNAWPSFAIDQIVHEMPLHLNMLCLGRLPLLLNSPVSLRIWVPAANDLRALTLTSVTC